MLSRLAGSAELSPMRRIEAFILAHKWIILAAGMVMSCLLYAAFLALPRQVSFSYAAPTCAGELVLLPGVHQAAGAGGFKLEHRGGWQVGGVVLASVRVCFVPTSAPVKGVARLASAPFGGWVFRTHYDVTVGDAPRVLEAGQQARALSQPLELKLSQPDRVFHYYVEANGKSQACTMEAVRLVCGIDKLGLAQGASHVLKLQRTFGGKKAGEVGGVAVAVLPAIKVTGVSIKPDEVIYSKPKSADIALDKPLAAAEAKLELLEGDKIVPVAARAKVDGMRVLLMWDDDLPREKTFRITLIAARASDGSTLDGAYGFNFRTSGGPKVLGVSIGEAGVSGDARVVVTFDQALAKDTNIAGMASISGGGASISRHGSNQVVFALQNIPRCGVFTLSIAKGVVSESGIAASQGWSQTSRATCRLTRTIGYSVRGRPIQAHFYGSGPTTVLFTGGIHGDEPSGVYLMDDWAAHLDANGYKIPAGKQVVVVPNLNPDGIAVRQRYNMNNVNIDRNFPTSDWISDIGLRDGRILPRGGGVTPLSEPETRAIADLTSSVQLRAMISFHSQGALVGANKVADSVAIGSLYARGVGYATMFYNPEEIMGYTLTGEYETWIGEKLDAPAVLVELPSHTGRFFSRHLNILWSMVNL